MPSKPRAMTRSLIFSEHEYRSRVANMQADARAEGLDAVIAFEPESVTYLTGFISPRGYNCFHFAVLPTQGEPTLFFRDVEAFHFNRSSAFDQSIRWSDGDDVDSAAASAIT